MADLMAQECLYSPFTSSITLPISQYVSYTVGIKQWPHTFKGLTQSIVRVKAVSRVTKCRINSMLKQ